MNRKFFYHPFTVALILTGLNALKPVAVDDTAYLTIARHIASSPLDPYGFELFWYSKPEPAMEILAPPVVPYWLAAGIAIFGEHVWILKLWLFPFLLILCYSVRNLSQRFAPGTEHSLIPLIGFSGYILPLIGFMLDIPATAFGLAAIALFSREKVSSTILAGICIATAMQTKYTAIVLPAVIVWYGIQFKRWKSAFGAVAISLAFFAAWELFLFAKYGQSHFFYHVRSESSTDGWLETKLGLALPLITQLGGLAVSGLFWTLNRSMKKSKLLALISIAVTFGFATVAMLPEKPSVGVAQVFFPLLGIVFLIVVLTNFSKSQFQDSGFCFLAGWLLIEIAAYFILTPFPAGRRIIGIAIVSTLILAKSNSQRAQFRSLGFGWFGIGLGLFVFAVDAWDARPEMELAQKADAIIKGQGGNKWFNGHWGFQYYCERAGMKPVVPDQSLLEPGDWLVFPEIPDDDGFYRPYHGGAKFRPDERFLERIETLKSDDWLSATTIPTLYGGRFPFIGRKHPRLQIVIYKVLQHYQPELIRE